MPILQQLHERVIDRFIDHAVHEHIGPFFDRRARRLQFSRMNRDADFVRMTFFNRRTDDRPKRIDRIVLIDDVPNLHQVWILFRQFAHEFARLIRRIDFHDRRIAKIKFLAGYT